MLISLICLTLLTLTLALASADDAPLDYRIQLDTVLKHDDGEFLWYHPRVAPVLGAGNDGGPAVVMTIQRHLHASDHYSGLYFLRTDDRGKTWTAPVLPPQLDWTHESEAAHIGVCDVTPGWHSHTGRLLALGAQVRYSTSGDQIEDVSKAQQTAYTTYDPATGHWTAWERLETPDEPVFNYARNACAQWLVKPDGNILIPLYHGTSASVPMKVTVALYGFDGAKLSYTTRGNTLELDEVRGLCEPSLAWYKGRYYLTIRHDERGYVTTSDDGLHYEPIKQWTFDDGSDLGSYNTQQHWVWHSEGLFLVYTRRGANNDHMERHRAPLFIAQVDTEKLRVVRATERILIPERGGEMGNFGATAVSPNESWVTVSEGIWGDASRKRGAEGATFVARVIWNRPNALYPLGSE